MGDYMLAGHGLTTVATFLIGLNIFLVATCLSCIFFITICHDDSHAVQKKDLEKASLLTEDSEDVHSESYEDPQVRT